MHCLPAFHDPNTVVGRGDDGAHGHERRARGHRRGVRVARRASCSTRPRTACTPSRRCSSPRSGAEARHAHPGRPRRQRPAEAGRADDGGGPAGQRPRRGRRARAGRRATTSSCSRTATARRSACSRCRPRPTRRSRPIRSTCSGAQTEGMIGYLIEQELGNLLPAEVPLATLLTMIEVDPARPGVRRPDQVRRPDLRRREAEALAAEKGWVFKRDGDQLRRVVPSPPPKRIFEIRPIRWLLGARRRRDLRRRRRHPDHVDARPRSARSTGVEAVIDKDLASELLARELDADLFVMATDVDGVYEGWGTPDAAPLDRGDAGRAAPATSSRPARWARRSRPRPSSSRRPASAPPSARSRTSSRSSAGTRGHERASDLRATREER